MRTVPSITAVVLLGALTACSAAPAPSEPDEAEAACEVGSWQLDVADYEAQALAYLLDTGIPVGDYALTGSGSLDIGADGFLTGVVDVTSTATLEPPGAGPVTIEVPSSYTYSGQWAAGAEPGTIDLTDWGQVADVGADDDGTIPPLLDFEDVPTVTSECTADTLRLQGPDAPLSALWHRA